MMTKEEILNSGLLEEYSLGVINDLDREIVEKALNAYPELKDHVTGLERALESIAFQNAIVPPEQLRQQTLQKIEEGETLNFKKSSSIYKWAASLAGIGALLFLVTTVMFYNKYNSELAAKEGLNSKLVTLSNDCEEAGRQADIDKRLLGLYESETYNPVNLNGADQSITVFWSNDAQEAYVSSKELSLAPKGKTYQIWADVDDVMMPLGTFNGQEKITKIKCLKNATSLNVTIEKEGGSDHPDVSQLILSKGV